MTNESNKAETIKEIDALLQSYLPDEYYEDQRRKLVPLVLKYVQEYSSIQQEEFRQQLDMWLSPENSKYYWEIVKIIESLNTK